MAEKFIYCSTGLADWDAWQIAAKEAINQEYVSQFPEVGVCQVEENYTDRITGVIQDTEIRLADDKVTFHSDRLIDPYEPVVQADPNKIIGLFDDSKISDLLNEAYYCTQTWRDANVGSSLTILDRAGAEAEGFDFGEEE